MVCYLLIILICTILISLFNILFSSSVLNLSPIYIIITTVIAVLFAFVIDLIIAIIVRMCPKKWFNPNHKIYRTYNWERKLYLKIKINSWKPYIPEMGNICNFKKDKVYDKNNPTYIFKFMEETCYAEVMHIISAILGFLIIFIFPLKIWYCITFPVAFVNCILQILPFFVQRYNRPKLLNLYLRLSSKTNNQQK